MIPDGLAMQRDTTDAQNDLLDLVLGYRSALTRVVRAAEATSGSAVPPEDHILLAVLGAHALERHLERWLCTALPPEDAQPTTARTDRHADLLR